MVDFTDPFVIKEQVKLTDQELMSAVRLSMASELDAITLYQAYVNATDNPVAKRVIGHIMDEEKEHIEEFAQLLYHLDAVQAEKHAHVIEEFQEGLANGGGEGTAMQSTSTVPPMRSQLTVGSLKET